METFEVIYVSWYLHDRWNGNEESGSSLHLNLDEFEKFHQRYLSKYSKNDRENNSHIPRKPLNAKVTYDLYQRLLTAEFGLNLNEEEDKLLIEEKKIILLL